MINSTSYEELLYLMRFIVDDIDSLVQNVINDSEADPHFSAVTAQNMILCYIGVMNQLGITIPFQNAKEYFLINGYSDLEYQLFETKRRFEAEYYIGKQFE